MQSNSITDDQPQQPTSPMRVCLHPDCMKKLQSNNTTGYCRRHRDHHKLTAKSQIIRLYTEGLSLSQVSGQLHVKRGFVERVITEAGCMRSVREGVRLSKLGRPRLNFSHPTHPGEGPVDNWKIVELKAAGKSNKEIAKQLKRAQPSIFWALRRMGFPSGTRVTVCYSFGEVFDKLALRRLREISDLNVTELAGQLDIGFATLEPYLAPRGGKRPHFNTARKASQWRKSLFSRLMSKASRHPGRNPSKYSQSRVIVTFFPHLRQRYSFLLDVLRRLAKKLRDNPEWSRDELRQYLCDEARRETAEEIAGRSPGDLFRRFLPWAPDLMPFLAAKLQDLRGVNHSPLAWELIAGSLGTTAPIISEVINPAQARNIRPIPPEQMRWLILDPNNQPQPETPKADKPGRGRRGRRGAAAEKRTYYRVGAAVEREIPTFNRLFEAKKATPASAKLRSLGFNEEQIEAALSSNTPTIAARRFISNTYRVKVKGKDKLLDYDTVAKYHQRFRRFLRLPGTEIAA